MIDARERGASPYDFDGVHAAVRGLLPGQPADPRRAAGGHGPADGRDVAAAGVDVARAAGRAPGAGRAGAAGHGPGVRGRPAGGSLAEHVPADAVGRSGAWPAARRPCRCRPRSTRWSACPTTRSWTGRCGATTPAPSLEDVDEDRLRRTLGEDAVRDVRRLKEIERALERAGLVTRERRPPAGHARAPGRLGERALIRVFEQLRRDREGTHDVRQAGGQAEPTGATRPWRFGDTGQIAVQRTVFNAVVRGGRRREAARARARGLRARRSRDADRGGHRAAAGPVVLDAAARALGPGQAHGAGAARADRGAVPARHAVPDRVQRLRAAR